MPPTLRVGGTAVSSGNPLRLRWDGSHDTSQATASSRRRNSAALSPRFTIAVT
jgi:hypothetical protein